MALSPQMLAGLKSRSVIALGRAMPGPLLLKLIGEEWHEEIQMSIYQAMKRLAYDLTERTQRPSRGRSSRRKRTTKGATRV